MNEHPFLKIDHALGQYYAVFARLDYFDAEGKGKFLKFVEENGFEEDDVEEEFANVPMDCMYVDFDEGFPLGIHDKMEDEDRISEIFKIIKYCYVYGTSPIPSIGTVTKPKIPKCQCITICIGYTQLNTNKYNLFIPNEIVLIVFNYYHTNNCISADIDIFNVKLEINRKTRKKCNKLYQRQCSWIYKEEDVFTRCFSISLVNNGYPFFLNLVDSYIRDQSVYFYENNKEMVMVRWRQKTPFFRKINIDEKKKWIDTLSSGIESFGSPRRLRFMSYGPSRYLRIVDSIKNISNYILMANNLVPMLLKQYYPVPFQIDFVIAVNKTKRLRINSVDSDDSDDSYYYVDEVGDVEYGLQSQTLPYHSIEIKHDEIINIECITKAIYNGYTGFTNKLSKTSYYKTHENEIKNYPQSKRFCAFIDRRKSNGEDRLTFFEPPSNCNSIPTDYVPEWFLDASLTYILPNKRQDIKARGAGSMVNGQLLTVSFHVISCNKIKAYLCWNGSYTRMYPQDLSLLFPDIFDMEYDDNMIWSKTHSENIYSKMEIRDIDFENFYRQVSYKRNNQFPKQYKCQQT